MADPTMTLDIDQFDGGAHLDKSEGDGEDIRSFLARIVSRLNEVITVLNKLRTDEIAVRTALALDKTVVDDLKAQVNALVTLGNEVKGDHNALRTRVNAIATSLNSALTKLDADAGVTDTNYNATLAVGADGTTDTVVANASAVASSTAAAATATATAAATTTGITVK